MKKIIIMSVAVIGSLLVGEPLMAAVLGLIMVSGLMAGCFMSESACQMVECPALALRPVVKKLCSPPSVGPE